MAGKRLSDEKGLDRRNFLKAILASAATVGLSTLLATAQAAVRAVTGTYQSAQGPVVHPTLSRAHAMYRLVRLQLPTL